MTKKTFIILDFVIFQNQILNQATQDLKMYNYVKLKSIASLKLLKSKRKVKFKYYPSTGITTTLKSKKNKINGQNYRKRAEEQGRKNIYNRCNI